MLPTLLMPTARYPMQIFEAMDHILGLINQVNDMNQFMKSYILLIAIHLKEGLLNLATFLELSNKSTLMLALGFSFTLAHLTFIL